MTKCSFSYPFLFQQWVKSDLHTGQKFIKAHFSRYKMYVLQKERDLNKALTGQKYLSVFKETIGKNIFVKRKRVLKENTRKWGRIKAFCTRTITVIIQEMW